MKGIWRVGSSLFCLIAIAGLLECGSGPSLPAPLTITSAALPNGTVETQYNQTIQASGGVGPYTWSTSTGTLPHNLQLIANGTNAATISGTPDTPVQKDAFTVKVTDTASQAAAQGYMVSILGVPDTLILSAASLSFNPQLDGTASATQTVTVSNTGSGPVAVNSVVATGSNAAEFSQSNTCGSGLAAGGECVITVTFTPSQAGPRVAAITINDDTEGTPHQAGLNGIGLVPGPNATLSAVGISFGGQGVGTTSPTQTLTLTNYGTAALNVANIAATTNFGETNTCGASLSSAASCPINVSFSPTASGSLTGTLSVNDNLGGSPQTVSLSGTGAASNTLTGQCFGPWQSDPNQCGSGVSPTSCIVGEVATAPGWLSCGADKLQWVDQQRNCAAKIPRINQTVIGYCMVNAGTASSKAVVSKSCR